jgi:hypothetical protein
VVPQAAPAKGARAGITFAQQQALVQQQQQQRQAHFDGMRSQQQQQQQQQKAQLSGQQAGLLLPCERADHVMVCWHYCDDGVWKDLLVVFGGSCTQGLLNDTWLFDVNTSSWTQVRHTDLYCRYTPIYTSPPANLLIAQRAYHTSWLHSLRAHSAVQVV